MALDDADRLANGSLPFDPEADCESEQCHVRDDEWPDPIPLRGGHDMLPFPLETLPDPLNKFAEALSVSTQTPPDMAALFTLAAVSSVAGGRIIVEPIEGWRESCNIFVAVAMDPGSRKSAVHREVLQPIYEYERDLIGRLRPELEEKRARKRTVEAHLKYIEKQIPRAKKDQDRETLQVQCLKYQRELNELQDLDEPRLVTSDCTPEALASLLCKNGGRIAILSAETSVFEIIAGRYGEGENVEIFLSGHSGDVLRIDRKNRRTEFINRPALTIGIAAQPYVLRKAGKCDAARYRGLLDRFAFSVPESNIGFRQINVAPLQASVRERYCDAILSLARSIERVEETYTLALDANARPLLDSWRKRLEERRRPSGDLASILGWAAKLDGLVVRISGLLHLSEHYDDNWKVPISHQTVEAAIRIGEYLTAHARVAFDILGTDEDTENARAVLRWICDLRKPEFTRRDCYRAHRGQFKNPHTLNPVLETLEQHGWIRQRLRLREAVGRPTEIYDVNPRVLDKMDKRTKLPIS